MVGCCRFDSGSEQCLSAVGSKVCFPEFNIRSSGGYCLRTEGDPKRDPALPVDVVECDAAKIDQEWTPTQTGQIMNPMGFCLEEEEGAAANKKIVAKNCTSTVNQILAYQQDTRQFKSQEQDGRCLSVEHKTKGKVTLQTCLLKSNPDIIMQQWHVSQTQLRLAQLLQRQQKAGG